MKMHLVDPPPDCGFVSQICTHDVREAMAAVIGTLASAKRATSTHAPSAMKLRK
jgi:hypothetical protein